ncbi:MAG: PilN domain-containing protein [Gallionella sp.]
MIRINLLPHRAEKRRVRQLQFFGMAGTSFVLGLMLVGLGHWMMSNRIAYQESRNQYLTEQTAILDKQIEEIKALRKKVDALRARKAVVDDLQATRLDVVHLLDQMLRILPEGVYLRSVIQNDNKITIVGRTQSNARVSTLMNSIELSPWLENAELIGINASGSESNRYSEFTLTFNLSKANGSSDATKKQGGGA